MLETLFWIKTGEPTGEAKFLEIIYIYMSSSLVAQMVKNLPATQKTPVRYLGQEDPLEKGIVWTEEPGGQRSMGSQRVGHDWVHTFTRWRTELMITDVNI